MAARGEPSTWIPHGYLVEHMRLFHRILMFGHRSLMFLNRIHLCIAPLRSSTHNLYISLDSEDHFPMNFLPATTFSRSRIPRCKTPIKPAPLCRASGKPSTEFPLGTRKANRIIYMRLNFQFRQEAGIQIRTSMTRESFEKSWKVHYLNIS